MSAKERTEGLIGKLVFNESIESSGLGNSLTYLGFRIRNFSIFPLPLSSALIVASILTKVLNCFRASSGEWQGRQGNIGRSHDQVRNDVIFKWVSGEFRRLKGTCLGPGLTLSVRMSECLLEMLHQVVVCYFSSVVQHKTADLHQCQGRRHFHVLLNLHGR